MMGPSAPAEPQSSALLLAVARQTQLHLHVRISNGHMLQAAARAALARSGAWAGTALPDSPVSSANSGSMSESAVTGGTSRAGSGATGRPPSELANGGSAAAEALAALADMTPGLGSGQGFGLSPSPLFGQGLPAAALPDRREVVPRSAIRAALSSQGMGMGSQISTATESSAVGRLQAHGAAAAAASARTQGSATQQAPVSAQQAAGAPVAHRPGQGLPLQPQASAAASVVARQAPAAAAPGGFTAAAAAGCAAALIETKVEAALVQEAAERRGVGQGELASDAGVGAEVRLWLLRLVCKLCGPRELSRSEECCSIACPAERHCELASGDAHWTKMNWYPGIHAVPVQVLLKPYMHLTW